jgi:hypothetical protein
MLKPFWFLRIITNIFSFNFVIRVMLERFRQQEREEYLMGVDVIVNEALRNKCWIFQYRMKRWYTPEEFKAEFSDATIYDDKWFDNFKLMDPIAGLRAADKQIEMIMEKRKVFQQRLFEYYQNKVK